MGKENRNLGRASSSVPSACFSGLLSQRVKFDPTSGEAVLGHTRTCSTHLGTPWIPAVLLICGKETVLIRHSVPKSVTL